MWNSLRVRMLLAQVIVVLLALGTIALLASRMTSNEFQRYLDSGTRMHNERLDATLMQFYFSKGDWEGVQELVDQMAEIAGERIILTDTRGSLIAESAPRSDWPSTTQVWRSPAFTITFNGTPIAILFVERQVEPKRGPIEGVFLSAVDRWMVLAFMVAGVSALVLTIGLSRRILSPVTALTTAARKMEQGDLSQRVQPQSQDEIGELARAFNAMAGSLQQAEQVRRNLVSDVAHELRTPLANIQGYLEAVRDGLLQPSTQVIDSLHEEALSLGHLVNDLQELSLAEAGQLHLTREPVSLSDLVQRAVNAAQPTATARGIALSCELPPEPLVVEVDRVRIGQVLRNLLENALLYTSQGGRVNVTVEHAAEELRVIVRDSGIGIEAEHLPHVFERFYRVDKSRARATGGSGLGLAIVKQWVEAHGGRVWAESTPGEGSTFGFAVPAGSGSV